jgi:outer membrane protein TolC
LHRSRPSEFLLLWFCSTLAILACGCQVAPPRLDAPHDIALATGTSDSIRFEVTGGLTDVEGPPQPDSLSLAEAVRTSLSREPRVQAALSRVRVALAESKQTRLLPNPVLNVALRFPEGGGSVLIDAGLSADLISLLRRPAQTRAADNRLRAAAAESVVVALDAVAEVQEAYAEAQALDAQLVVLDGQLKLNDRLLQLARSRLEAGESGRLDVLTLDAQRLELETEEIQRRADARDKRLILARLLGRPSKETDWKLDTFEPPVAWTGDEDEQIWTSVALMHRPEIQARQWELAALGDDAALARLALLDGTEVGVEAERDDGWSVGPAVSTPIPIFDWGQARKAKADAQRIEAHHRATETRRQVIEDVRRAMVRLVAARAALDKVRSQLLPVQQRRHEQAEEAYKAGLADITALLVAEQELQASRAKLVEVQKDAAVALVRLHRAVGGSGVAASIPPAPTTTVPTTGASTRPAAASSRTN